MCVLSIQTKKSRQPFRKHFNNVIHILFKMTSFTNVVVTIVVFVVVLVVGGGGGGGSGGGGGECGIRTGNSCGGCGGGGCGSDGQ